jgi:chromosome partitioning protein
MNDKPSSGKTSLTADPIHAPASHRATPRCFVLAVANQKGGVAKTTTVVSLGGALARLGQEVLLVDLDAQANLTLALGKDPARVRGAITDVLFDSASLLSVSRETEIGGLDLVPSNGGLELAERFLPVRKNYEIILSRALDGSLEPGDAPTESRNESPTESTPTGLGPRPYYIQTKRRAALYAYDFIILDCPPFMGAVTLNALNAADMLIIPTQPEFFSVHSLRTMMNTVRQVRSQHNPELVYRILITMHDRRNRIHREVKEQIESAFSEGLFQTTIGIDTKLRESAVEGLPITHYKSRSRSALQYDALAQELIEYVKQSQ